MASGDSSQLHDLNLLGDPDEAMAFINRLYHYGKQIKAKMENVWYMHIRHFAGNWYYDFDLKSGMIEENDEEFPAEFWWRMAAPVAPGMARQMYAKWMRGNMLPRVLPSTDDQNDRDRSEHFGRLARFHVNHLDIDRIRREALTWLIPCHNVFIKSCWNPDGGQGNTYTLQDLFGGNEQDMQFGQQGSATGPGDAMQRLGIDEKLANYMQISQDGSFKLFEGDNECEVRSPFDIIPDPQATTMRDCRYVLDTSIRTREYLLERYPEKAEEIESMPAGHDAYESGHGPSQMMDIGSGGGAYGLIGQDESYLSDTFLVHEFTHKPCGQYPDGVHLVCTPSVTLRQQVNHYGFLNYVHLYERYVPGQFWGSGAWSEADQVQRTMNRIHSKICEHIARCTNPTYLHDQSLGLDVDELTTIPGGFNKVNNVAGGLRMMNFPDMPRYVMDELERLYRHMQEIFGVFDPSMGKATTSNQSGRAIIALTEMNEAGQDPIIRGIEKGFSDMFKQQLSISAAYYSEERTIWIVGEDGEREFHTIKEGDLVGEDAGHAGLIDYDVEVEIERYQSKFEQMEVMEFLQKMGVLDPVRDRDAIMSGIRFNTPRSGTWDRKSAHRSIANREHHLMLQGQYLPPSASDDHTVHIEELREFQTKEDYKRSVQQNPIIGEIFKKHEEEHWILAAEQSVSPQIIHEMVKMQLMQRAGLALAAPGPESNGQAANGTPQPAGV